MKSIIKVALASAIALGAATAARAADISLDRPWLRATPAGAKVGAGYVTVKNSGAAPDRLVGATAEVATRAEVHEMSMAEGVMKMRQVAGIDIPAGQSVELKPGGYHIMMLNLKQPLTAGDTVKGSLVFEKAGSVPVEFKVEFMGATSGAPSGEAPADLHHMQH